MKRTPLLLVGVCAWIAVIAAGCSSDNPGAPDNGGTPHALLRVAPDNARIPGQYIVVLKSSVNGVPEVAAEMSRSHGLGVEHVYSSALKGFSAQIPEARLNNVLADPRVEYIEEDQEVFACAQTLPWGISATGADSSTAISGNGSGAIDNVDVYILDTGIETTHPDLNVVGGYNFTKGKTTAYGDGNGHGTHVAGAAAARDNSSFVVGMAPGAPLYAIKVLNNSGSGSNATVIAGLDYVRGRKNNNPERNMVANLSLSGGASSAVDQAVRNCIAAGVVVCVAAGNNGQDASAYSPARTAEAITVGAHDINNLFASFSNYGSVVDINAPGVSILSTWKGGTTNTISGTSMATPHVCGAAALYLSTHPGASPATVRDALVNDAAAWVNVSRPNTTNKTLRVTTY